MFSYFKRPKIDNTNTPVLALIGDGEVGKTSLKNRLMTLKAQFKFNHEYIASDGVAFVKITFPTNYGEISILLEDTPGQQKFDSVRTGIVKGADMVIAMYDITVPKTLENIRGWLKYLDCCHKPPTVMVIGNKIDEASQSAMHQTVHLRKAQLEALYDRNNIDHCQVSIKDKTNLKKAFEILFCNYYKVNDIVIDQNACSFRI
jgi:small GTP-binding protein